MLMRSWTSGYDSDYYFKLSIETINITCLAVKENSCGNVNARVLLLNGV